MEYLDSCAVVPRRIICLLAASVFVNLYAMNCVGVCACAPTEGCRILKDYAFMRKVSVECLFY